MHTPYSSVLTSKCSEGRACALKWHLHSKYAAFAQIYVNGTVWQEQGQDLRETSEVPGTRSLSRPFGVFAGTNGAPEEPRLLSLVSTPGEGTLWGQ